MAIRDYQTYTGKLVVETCYKCGVVFGMDNEFYEAHRRDKSVFYCPNGHPQAYTRNAEDELRREVERLQSDTAYWRNNYEGAERRRAAMKGVVTRTKNRIAAGKCPECGDHFPNLHRHMHERHPDYTNSPDGD